MTQSNFSIKRHGLGAALFCANMFVGSSVFAATVSCPNPVGTTQTRVYQTSGAVDCVWGNGNIGGNANQDEFLLGNGTNDAEYGNLGVTFGKTWTTIDSQDYNEGNGTMPVITGLTVSNLDDDSFNWAITNTTYSFYALGLKDGDEPKWAVFLLSSLSGLAEITSNGGAWSHVALYGSNTGGGTDDDVVPEPASLALVGLALTGLAISRRRGRKQ